VNSKVLDLKKEMETVEGGIASKTIRNSRDAKVVLFRFDAGQQLTEHTATVAASIQIVDGLAKIKLGSRSIDATPGTWIDMEPGLAHAILAKTPVVMLLTLFHREKGAKPAKRSAVQVC
jgi:quercetin dioxygenase-like cupin family protein